MTKAPNISLVEGNFRRRAAILHCLTESGIRTEPFAEVSVLIDHGPRDGILLVSDDTNSIHTLLDHMWRSGQWLPIIGFAQNPTTRMVVQAVLEGAIDYIDWPFDPAEINRVAVAAKEKAKILSHSKLREALARSRVGRLSRRERQVLEGVASGMSSRQISDKLSISSRTVEVHRVNMIKKLEAKNTPEAIRIVIESNVSVQP